MNTINPRVVNNLKLLYREKEKPYLIYNIKRTLFNYKGKIIIKKVNYFKVFIKKKN
jgi:hypothetical protein